MKNLIRKISLIMCVIMLTFAVSACGKSDNDSKKNEPKTEDTAKDDAKDWQTLNSAPCGADCCQLPEISGLGQYGLFAA